MATGSGHVFAFVSLLKMIGGEAAVAGAGGAVEKAKNPGISDSNSSEVSLLVYCAAVVALIWYIVVLGLAYSGVVQIFRKFNGSILKRPPFEKDSLEPVTILRPLKGLDPEVKICLESSLHQYYPKNKFEVLFCVESPDDPVISVVKSLLAEHPDVDARLLVGNPSKPNHFGPNPKINNMAKGFVEAKYDIIWVMDSNVWASNGTLIRSVYSLQNSLDDMVPTFNRVTQSGMPVKVVHHLPLAVTLNSANSMMSNFGCKLDEVYLKTSHAKFYVGFDKVCIAPCVNGKSNMYRISDIDLAVKHIGKGQEPSVDGQSGNLAADAAFYGSKRGYGIRYFSKFIGEDNMIAIALWNIGGRSGMTGDSVLQPLGNHMNNGVKDYILRRSRWLRVRRYMVLAATLLEPTTESIVASLYGTFGVSVVFLHCKFSLVWLCFHFAVWYLTDYLQFHLLVKNAGTEDAYMDGNRPFFADPKYSGLGHNNDFKRFTFFWLLRELLALPIWVYALSGGTIDWRGRPFKINSDLTASEI